MPRTADQLEAIREGSRDRILRATLALRAWSESLRRDIEGVLTAAGLAVPAVEAAVLFALIDGVAQHHAMAPRRYPIASVTNAIVERYRTLCS